MTTVSLPTELLKMTSADGKLVANSSCIIQFKVKLLDKRYESGCFVTELQLFNHGKNGLISSDHYEMEFVELVHLTDHISPSKRQPTWKLKFMMDHSVLNAAAKSPLLKFHLEWSKQLFIKETNCAAGKKAPIHANIAARRVFTRHRSTGRILSRTPSITNQNENVQCHVYQFIHNNIRQKTDIWDGFKCPWCIQRSSSLYYLLKHLSLCHDRFKFKYAPAINELRIDVMVNQEMDDLRNDPFSRFGTKFCGKWPVKRRTMTAIQVFRPERYRPRLAEFLWNLDDGLFGRKRNYYHSYNGLEIRPNEIDENSEDEMDPLWLRQNICRLIDDFIDVNAGEKEIMKLWNLHVLANNYVCDAQMGTAILSFVQNYGEQILRQNLYRNCLMHICNLSDYCLITSSDAYKSVRHLQMILLQNSDVREIVFNRLKEQRKFSMLPNRKVAAVAPATAAKKRPHQMLPETPRRKMDRISMRKRLRSHALISNIRNIEIHRSNDNDEKMIEFVKPRVPRKSAPIWNGNNE